MKSVQMPQCLAWSVILVPLAIGLIACGGVAAVQVVEPTIGDAPALEVHTSQEEINNGELSLEELVQRGEDLFVIMFNTLDGAGRPETADIDRRNNVSVNNPRPRQDFPNNFNRISGPDANACVACHGVPRMGGGGDNAANIFAIADRLPFVNFDGGEGDNMEPQTLLTVGNERNSLGMFGVGWIELLAREMTTDLRGIAEDAIREAKRTFNPVTRDLVTKGVSFGRITANSDATLDTSELEGVDEDLIIRPFQQKGVVVSLREFSVKAMNSHFGMQASEQFRDGVDFDRDGVVDELTRGDITALVLFQATLPVPGEVLPDHPKARAAMERGKELFSEAGCTSCHVPALPVNNPVFTEPSPFNPRGKLQPTDVNNPFAVDLTIAGPGPYLRRGPDGSVMVPAFTDLKRHKMGDILNNEVLVQDGVPTDEWITRKLWGFASEPPFLHHGRATLISEAVLAHGGEAQESRNSYAALSAEDQAAVVEFLKTLQVLPEGSTGLVVATGVMTATEIRAIWVGVGVALVMLAGGAALTIIRRRAPKDGAS